MLHNITYDPVEYEIIHSTSHYDAELITMRDRVIELYNNNRMTADKFHLYCAAIIQEYTNRYPIELRKVETVDVDGE